MREPLSCGFEVGPHGVRLGFASAWPEALEALRERVILPGWAAMPLGGEPTFVVEKEGPTWRALCAGEPTVAEVDLEKVSAAVASLAHHRVAEEASDALFVHAGVVGWGQRGVLLPGRSFAGKSTLTAALVEAGATYYSDEYAVIDPESGLVHAFPRALNLRERRLSRTELGGRALPSPVRVQAVFQLRYAPEADWRVEPLSAGETVLTLFDNTVAAQRLGLAALPALQRTIEGARGWRGTRSEASEAALQIQRLLSVKRWPEP